MSWIKQTENLILGMAQGRGLLNELIGNQANDQARRVKMGQLLRKRSELSMAVSN